MAQPVVVEEEEEMTADQLRHIAEPWFATIPAQVPSLAKKVQWEQGVGGNHAAVNMAKKEMMKQNVEKAGLGDSGAVKFLGGVRALHCLF